MARQRLTRVRRDRGDSGTSTPAQQDEADIVKEVGAEFNEELNEFVAPEDKIRELGAVDSDSVIENRRLDDIVGKKRAHMSGVPFNASDLQTKYETIIRVWPPNTLEISVKRLTGSPIQRMIISQPRSGVELYNALMEIHGQSEEAKYELKFFDKNGKEFRGNGQITMPDTQAPKPQQGQPMNNYPPGYPPPGYPPPGYPPQAAAPGYPQHPGYAQQPQAAPPQQQAAPAPQATQPFVFQAPPGPDMNAMFDGMRQMFGMFQEMQRQNPAMQPQAAPQPQPQYIPMPQQAPPPMPPAGADMPTMMAWMRQMFDLFQGMQPQPAPPQRGERHVPQQQTRPQEFNPMWLGAPPMTPPPGTMWFPNIGFVPLVALAQAMGAPPPPQEQGRGGGPYRPSYARTAPYQQGDPNAPQQGYENGPQPYRPEGPYREGGYRPGGPPPAAPPPQNFRESLTYIRGAMSAMQELNALLPQQQGGGAQEIIEAPEDDSPVQVIDAGPAKIVVNKKDGSLRGWETAWANSGDLLKWFGEQREKIQDAQARREQPRQLAPGYVEVHPGYVPPPGYGVVPVEQPQYVQQQQPLPYQQPQQQPLAPPPQHVPPPIQSAPPQAGRGWGMPTIPGQGGT